MEETYEQLTFISGTDREGNLQFKHNFEMVTPEYFRSRLDNAISETKGSIIITAHSMPDDDAIFSALAARELISSQNPGKQVKIVLSEKRIGMWDNFTGAQDIIWAASETTQDGKPGDLVDHLQSGDLLLALDQGEPRFFSKRPAELAARNDIRTLILDHHPAGNPQMHEGFIQQTTSAAELLAKIYDLSEVSPQAAALLYMGMSGDTRNFSFRADYGATKVLADQLLEKSGQSYTDLESQKIREPQMAAYIEMFQRNTQVIEPPNGTNLPRITYSYITSDEYRSLPPADNTEFQQFIGRRDAMYEMSQSDSEGVMFTLVPIEPDSSGQERYSVMFRRGNHNRTDVSRLAKILDNGGGHPSAASGRFVFSEGATSELNTLRQENSNLSTEEYVAAKVTQLIYQS